MNKLEKLYILVMIFTYILFSCENDTVVLKEGDKIEIHPYTYSETYKLVSVPVPPEGIVFPIGYDDDDTAIITKKYSIGENEVTVGLWYTVANWATFEKEGEKYTNIYFTKHKYFEPDAMDYPINDITFIQALAWCNAYTEWHNTKYGTNLIPVYTDSEGKPIRYAPTPLNPSFAGRYSKNYFEFCNDYLNNHEYILEYLNNKITAGNGFRLPTHHEWELAARWNGTDNVNTVTDTVKGIDFSAQQIKFTKGNSASGAKDDVSNLYETHKYAYFRENSNLTLHLPKNKLPNALGLYDMSGNIAEIVYNVEYIYLRAVGVDFPFIETRGGNYMFVYTDPPMENVESVAIGRKIVTEVVFSYNYPYGLRIARDDQQ